MSNEYLINFGGKVEANREYVYTLTEIEMTPGVIQYTEFAKDTEKHSRTLDSLTPDEFKRFFTAPDEPIKKNGEVLLKKDGTPRMKPKVQDQIRFIFTNDDTGSKTGLFDFMYRLDSGKIEIPYKPKFGASYAPDFKAFLQLVANRDPSTLGGNKAITDLVKIGTKVVLKTVQNGNWVNVDPKTLKPYVEGMVLATSDSGGSPSDLEQKMLDFIQQNKPDTVRLLQGIEGFSPKDVSSAFTKLKDAGKVKIQGGLVVLA